MKTRRIGAIALVVGLVFMLAPLYWRFLYSVPLVPAVLDPFAAMGFSPGGAYPAAAGTATAVIALAILNGDDVDGPGTNTVLVAVVLGAIASVGFSVTFHDIATKMATLVGLAGVAPVFGTVAGVAIDRRIQRWGYVLGGVALAPMLGFQILRGTSVGGLAGFASLFAAAALVVYTPVLWYSFYRLGQVVSA